MTPSPYPVGHRRSGRTSRPGPHRPARPQRFRLATLSACSALAIVLTGSAGTIGSPTPTLVVGLSASAAAERSAAAAQSASAAAPAAAPAAAALPTGSPPEASAAVAASAAPEALRTAWIWPVGPPRQLLHAFEAPADRYAAGHRGIDLVAAEGNPVRSPAEGVVTFVGTVVDRPVLSIQHGNDLISSFEPVTATVSEGDRVQAGQLIGIVATGAHCTGRCVHFGVRRHGQYISPVLFLGGLARAVLLPLPPAGPVPLPVR